MDPNVVLSALVSIVGLLIILLYRGHDTRLFHVENILETKDHAEKAIEELKHDLETHSIRDETQFRAVQDTIKDFRADMDRKLEVIRSEGNEKRIEVRNDLLTYRSETNTKIEKLSDEIRILIRGLNGRKR